MSAISLPDQLYNKKTLFTLSGSSISVWLLTIVINDAFDLHQKHKWIGLIVSLLLSFIGATQIRKLNLSLFTVAFFNGLLIYVTATGIDSINNGTGKTINADSLRSATLIPFLRSDPWWPPEELVNENTDLKQTNSRLLKDLAIQKEAFLVLTDSLTKAKTPQSRDCQTYLAEIEMLKQRIKSLTHSSNAPIPVPASDCEASKQEVQNLVSGIKTENIKVLKALEDYLNIPMEKPLDKKKKIPQLEEAIFAWRGSLLDYNDRLESISKKIK